MENHVQSSPSVKHVLGVLEWSYVIPEKTFFQKQSLVRGDPSIALYYISLLIGFGKYSIEWCPLICVCRLEMELLRPKYTKMDPFFGKMLNVHM